MAGGAARTLLVLCVLSVALLCAEGALSLASGRSLRELLGAPRPPSAPRPPRAPRDAGSPAGRLPVEQPGVRGAAPRVASGVAPAGARGDLYTVHDDPLVGYVLLPDADLTIYEGRVRTDALGLRSRPGPPPPANAQRIVVLGDSVAFGLGVNDDEALASRLEVALALARGPDARPVVCRTVAVPSWNHRSAAAFLADHWDELDPDIVLYLPSANDVLDIDSAYPSGLRRVMPDPAARDPWLAVSVRNRLENEARRRAEGPDATLSFDDLGALAIDADLSPESSHRLDENADSIAALAERLALRDCKLLLVWVTTSHYTWFLSERLARRVPELPVTALLEYTRTEFTLGFDPHFNPATLDVWGRWLAEDLLERGWVSRSAGGAPAPAPQAYAELRFRMPPRADWASFAERARGRWRERLLREVDWRSGRGLLQVFGGCNLDGSARSRVLVLLGPGGGVLELELAPLTRRPDLYPLAVDVELDGLHAGRVVVPPDGPVVVRLPLPAGVDRLQPHELRLSPERWVVLGEPDAAPGTRQLVSFLPLRAALVDP
jgi:hypothetical protein